MLACPKCDKALPDSYLNSPVLLRCPECSTMVRVEAFPALVTAPAQGHAGESLLTEDESSCFYHPAKRAVTACESCGRFLCALCDVDLNGQHLCPACLDTGKRKGRLKQLENRRTLYDSLALTLALAPMLIYYFTILTSPAVLYVVIRYWKMPTSVVGRTRWRMVVAAIVAILQIAGWIAVFYLFWHLRALKTAIHR